TLVFIVLILYASHDLSFFFFLFSGVHLDLHSFPTRRSSDLLRGRRGEDALTFHDHGVAASELGVSADRLGLDVAVQRQPGCQARSEEHTSELQSRSDLVCRLLLEKKKKIQKQRLHK